MGKLKLDPELLRVQSFQTAGVQPSDLMTGGQSPGRCCDFALPSDFHTQCQHGCDKRGIEAYAAHTNEMFDGCAPFADTGTGCQTCYNCTTQKTCVGC